jgi:molybdopterin converting factor small subunit
MIAGKDSFQVEVTNSATVMELIEKLTEIFTPSLKRVLIDPELCDPRPNALILVNGKEVSVLDGMNTRVYPGDEVLFILVSHGG